MAKRAPILGTNYNPVGEKLRRVLQTAAETSNEIELVTEGEESQGEFQGQEGSAAETTTDGIEAILGTVALEDIVTKPVVKKNNVLELPKILAEESGTSKQPLSSSKNILTTELRCRCTKEERKKWNNFAMKITGEQNQFSHIFRAVLLLLEHAEDELLKQQHKIENIESPPKQNTLAVTFYEQKLASYIWEALRRAGRPESY